MQGERLSEVQVTAEGVLGDRTLALVDAKTGQVPSTADAKLFASLLECHAEFVDAPTLDADFPPVRITLPGGTTITTDSPELPQLLAAHFGRDLDLVRSTPAPYSAAQAAFFAKVGIGLSPTQTFVDYCPLSLITSSTLDTLATSCHDARLDLARFRMNIKITTAGEGFIENDWVSRRLELGADVQLAVPMADPRCAVTTLPQGDLPRDPSILRTIARVNSRIVGTGGAFPCAGVYATVLTSGTIRLGDAVRLA